MAAPTLQRMSAEEKHNFTLPSKRIHDGDDVAFFLGSCAYADIMTFVFQLNSAMLPRQVADGSSPMAWEADDSTVPRGAVVEGLAELLNALTAVINEAPPDTGSRRFGNVSFRTWYEIVKVQVSELLDRCLPTEIVQFPSATDINAKSEMEAYLLGSFGNAQRLDYGTGHELSFLAFLGCLWKLGAFPDSVDGEQERNLVLGVVVPYLELIRRLILTYTLEPAGSHGVWGLDDHSFLPYIFGSAQLSPAVSDTASAATEGSLPRAPDPGDITKPAVVALERTRNMYFGAIGFIFDVKKGPFWEHSPILYDISGVKAGWAKINKGMIKMYNAEVLSKFPVVQHFPFGSLFKWERDPNARAIQATVHTASQPKSNPFSSSISSHSATSSSRPQPVLRDSLALANQTSTQSMRSLRTSTSLQPSFPSGPDQLTRVPWTSETPEPPSKRDGTMAPRTRSTQGPGT